MSRFEERRRGASEDSCQVIAGFCRARTRALSSIRYAISARLYDTHEYRLCRQTDQHPRKIHFYTAISSRGVNLTPPTGTTRSISRLQRYYCFDIARPRRDRTARYLYLPNSFSSMSLYLSFYFLFIFVFFFFRSVSSSYIFLSFSRVFCFSTLGSHADRVSDLGVAISRKYTHNLVSSLLPDTARLSPRGENVLSPCHFARAPSFFRLVHTRRDGEKTADETKIIPHRIMSTLMRQLLTLPRACERA